MPVNLQEIRMPTDFSNAGDPALQLALMLTDVLSAQLHTLHVVAEVLLASIERNVESKAPCAVLTVCAKASASTSVTAHHELGR